MRKRSISMTLLLVTLLGLASSRSLGQPQNPTDSVTSVKTRVQTMDELAVGSEILVLMKSGRRLRGYFVSRADHQLSLRIGALVVSVPEDQVDRIVPQRPAIERYRDMRSVIDDADLDRLLILIEWLRNHQLYTEAAAELDQVMSLEPDNPDGIRLRKLIDQEIRLRDRSANHPNDNTPAPPERVRSSQRLKPGEFPLLTEEQANLLKVWEIDLNDSPRLTIERKTVDDFLSRYGDDAAIPTTQDGREAFHRRLPVDILSEMFRLRARDLYGAVKVSGLPTSLELFRDNVNSTWLVNNCSTTRCHGGAEAGRLLLYNRHANAELPALTNFLILDRTTLSTGRPLIDYENPERSPLLQLGLTRKDSAFAHPSVKGWRPAFRTMDASRFTEAVDWIRTMRQPHTPPPIDFTPPGARGDGQSRKSGEPQPR